MLHNKEQHFLEQQEASDVDVVSSAHFFPIVNKKAEKLITALYMVTDCMGDEEPLKKKLRTLGVELISDLRLLPYALYGELHVGIAEMSGHISEIISFLEITVSVGFISDMNFVILRKEFNSLRESLNKKFSTQHSSQVKNNALSNNFVLPKDLFINEEANNQEAKSPEAIARSSEAGFREEIEIEKKEFPYTFINPFNESKGHVLNRFQRQEETAPSVGVKRLHQAPSKHNENRRSKVYPERNRRALDIGLKIERRNNIIKFIKDKKEVTIKDIVTIIEGCSQKTVQRELMSLIKEGVLKKIGEKRWSKYAIC